MNWSLCSIFQLKLRHRKALCFAEESSFHTWLNACTGQMPKHLLRGQKSKKKSDICVNVTKTNDSKTLRAQGLGPGSPWNTWWQGAAREFHTGCAPLEDETNLPQPQHCLIQMSSLFPEGFSPLHDWFREVCSSQLLLLLSNISHKHLTGHFFGSETAIFSLFMKHQVSSH